MYVMQDADAFFKGELRIRKSACRFSLKNVYMVKSTNYALHRLLC